MKMASYIIPTCLVVLAISAVYHLGRTHGRAQSGRYAFEHLPSNNVISFARLDTATGRIELVGLSVDGKSIRKEIVPAAAPDAPFDPFTAGLAHELPPSKSSDSAKQPPLPPDWILIEEPSEKQPPDP
jgi:hypothetical protein